MDNSGASRANAVHASKADVLEGFVYYLQNQPGVHLILRSFITTYSNASHDVASVQFRSMDEKHNLDGVCLKPSAYCRIRSRRALGHNTLHVQYFSRRCINAVFEPIGRSLIWPNQGLLSRRTATRIGGSVTTRRRRTTLARLRVICAMRHSSFCVMQRAPPLQALTVQYCSVCVVPHNSIVLRHSLLLRRLMRLSGGRPPRRSRTSCPNGATTIATPMMQLSLASKKWLLRHKSQRCKYSTVLHQSCSRVKYSTSPIVQ